MKIFKKICSFILIIFFLIICNSCDKKEEVKIIDIDLTSENYAYVVKEGNTTLINQFNEFLVEIKEDGTFDEILDKYFQNEGMKLGVEYVTTQESSNDDKTLIVATNTPFEPFEYIGDDGLIYGIDIEIAQLFATKHNMKLVVKNIDFDSIFTCIDANYADIGMAGITITPEREALYDFTMPYYEASQKLVVLHSNEDFKDCKTADDVNKILNSLDNVKIGFQNGTTGHWYVVGDDSFGFKGLANVEAIGYKTAQLAINDILNGQIYGVIVDAAPANIMVNQINNLNNLNLIEKIKTFINAISKEKFQTLILTGLFNTLLIAICGLLIGIIIGTIIALIKVAPKYKKIIRIFNKICDIYVAIFRGTPIVVQLLLAYYVILPILSIKGVDALLVGIIVFGLNSGAYVSEIMRGGINSVDKGQLEAGRALGLSYNQCMIKIVIPQAIKNILPTLGNEFISLIKETSVVSFITVVDLYTAFNNIGNNTYSVIIPYIVMALIYIVLVVIISLLIKILEKRFAKNDRNR